MKEELLDSNEIPSNKKSYWFWLKIVERAAVVLVVIGFLFKTMHWMWGVELVMFPSLILSFLYLIFYFKLIATPSEVKPHLGLSLFIGFTLSTTVLILLFRIMLWPGMGTLTNIGFVCIALIGGHFIFVKRNLFGKKTGIKSIARLALVGGFALFLHTVSIRSQIDFYYDNQASDTFLDAFVDQYENPNNEAMHERYRRLRTQHLDSINALEYNQ